jgi:hypothetical protein
MVSGDGRVVGWVSEVSAARVHYGVRPRPKRRCTAAQRGATVVLGLPDGT